MSTGFSLIAHPILGIDTLAKGNLEVLDQSYHTLL